MADHKPYTVGQIAFSSRTIPVRRSTDLTSADIQQDPPAAPAPGLMEALLEDDTDDHDIPPTP